MKDYFSNLKASLFDNFDRLILFLPLFYGIGIGFYFLSGVDIAWYVLIPVAGLLGGAVYLCRHTLMFFVFVALLTVVLGYGVSILRSGMVGAPILYKPFYFLNVEGRVLENTLLPSAQRVVLGDLDVSEKWKWFPKKVRIKINGTKDEIKVGDRLRTRVNLIPPPVSSYPGGYDFSTKAWFAGIGAVGYNVGKVQLSEEPSALKPADRFTIAMEGVRRAISLRIRDVIPGDAGRVALALTTGEQSSVSPKMMQDYRDSGVVHILSVSGMHMSALAFMVFAFCRKTLALFPRAALRYDTKKISAVLALFAAFLYLMISGQAVAAVRSYIMVAVAFAAILIDRRAISLRSVAIAALILLTMNPENLFNPGFQMSFAAVAALIGLYENHFSRKNRNYFSLFLIYVYGVIIAAVIGTLSTAIFGMYHFNRFPTYSVLGNLLVAGAFSFVVMPGLLIACVLMPFGLDYLPLKFTGMAIEITNRVITYVAGLPHAVLLSPNIPAWTVVVLTVSGYLFIILRGKWKYLLLASVLPVAFAIAFHEKPDFIVNGDGSLYALKSKGGLVLSPGTGNRLERSSWLEANAQQYGPESRRESATLFSVICDKDKTCRHRLGDFDFVFSVDKGLKEKYVKVYRNEALYMELDRKAMNENRVSLIYVRSGELKMETVRGRKTRYWGAGTDENR